MVITKLIAKYFLHLLGTRWVAFPIAKWGYKALTNEFGGQKSQVSLPGKAVDCQYETLQGPFSFCVSSQQYWRWSLGLEVDRAAAGLQWAHCLSEKSTLIRINHEDLGTVTIT